MRIQDPGSASALNEMDSMHWGLNQTKMAFFAILLLKIRLNLHFISS